MESLPSYDGIGFVLSDIIGVCYTDVDLDKVISAEITEPWAQEIINELDTYAEISPSDTGVKLLVTARLLQSICSLWPK